MTAAQPVPESADLDDESGLTGHVTVRFPEALAAAAKQLAAAEGMTVSAWIRREVEREAARRERAEAPAMTPAVARPSLGSTLVLAVGEDASDESVASAVKALTAATEGEGVTVVTVRGVEALRAWEPQPKPGEATALANAALQKAIDARRDHEAARAAASRIMSLVPLGRHASPDECEQIRRELRAIVTGVPS